MNPVLITIDAESLGVFIIETLVAVGCDAGEAGIVAHHLVDAEVVGRGSHGVVRLVEYLREIEVGRCDPRARPNTVVNRSVIAVINGQRGLGAVCGRKASATAIQKASECGVAVVTLRNCGHLGRIGRYVEDIAGAGLLGLAFVNAGRQGYQVPAFGGIDGRISTNPIAFGAPRRGGPPIVADLCTSTVSEGRLRLALLQKETVPQGCIVDAAGHPSTDPADFLTRRPRGAILPLGGQFSYKGYALGVMVEILAGALAGAGCAAGETEFTSNGMVLVALDVAQFIDLQVYFDEVNQLVTHLKTSQLASGFTEILLPGEVAARRRVTASSAGVSLSSEVWASMVGAAAKVGVIPAVIPAARPSSD
jgi:uncharacterized oxidoreductase